VSELEPVIVDSLPRSLEEFRALREGLAVKPQGGAAMMILALHAFAEDQDLGLQFLVTAVDRDGLQPAPADPMGFRLRPQNLQLIRNQVKGKPHLLRSCMLGTSPETGYALPALPIRMAFSDNPYSGNKEAGPYKVFVACSGAATPRPIQVKKNDKGIWKASEWSSVLVGVKAPPKPPDTL
jgi:hypothetical protein